MFQSDAWESNMAKPSWCLLVITRYFMPASLARRAPLVGLEFAGIESFGEFPVLGDGDFAPVHDPLANALNLLPLVGASGNGIHAPVNEHAEARFPPPAHAGVTLGGRLGSVGVDGLTGRGGFGRWRARRRDRGQAGSQQQGSKSVVIILAP